MEFHFDMHALASELFPLCRSLTGEGVRKTFDILKREVPILKTYEVPTGTQVFDWVVPKEWRISEAYIEDANGTRIIDFANNNLHVVGYSAPIDKIVSLKELKEMIYTLPEQPEWIPYVTSYYKERSGFCMSHNQMMALPEGEYHVVIKSELFEGSLTYGEVLIPGQSEEEIFFSTYVCHPSMGNNELSGVCVATALAKYLLSLSERKYSYRIIFIPETIGAITYLQKNLAELKQKVQAGFVITCVGDERVYSYLESRKSDTLADIVAQHVLKHLHPDYIHYTFLDRQSDERQYGAPGIDLPVCSVMRSKYDAYPEYHTSADDLTLITQNGLAGALNVYCEIIQILENNVKYKATCLCEPQLGKRGLYPTASIKGSALHLRNMMNVLAYSDGTLNLLQLAEKIKAYAGDLVPIINQLTQHNLLEEIKE